MHFAHLIASIPPPPTDGIELGPVKIHIYALCIIAGGILAFWLGGKRWAARGGKPEHVYDVGLWAVIFGIMGGGWITALRLPTETSALAKTAVADPGKSSASGEAASRSGAAFAGGAVAAGFG